MRTAVYFFLFIALIVILADMGRLPRVITFALDKIPCGDKLGHFILFGLLNFFAVRAALRTFPAREPLRAAAFISLLLALLVAGEEYSQHYFAKRTPDWVDLFSGYAGMAFGALAALKRAR